MACQTVGYENDKNKDHVGSFDDCGVGYLFISYQLTGLLGASWRQSSEALPALTS